MYQRFRRHQISVWVCCEAFLPPCVPMGPPAVLALLLGVAPPLLLALLLGIEVLHVSNRQCRVVCASW